MADLAALMDGFLSRVKQAANIDIPNSIPEDTRRLIRSFADKYNINTAIHTDAKKDIHSYYIPDTPRNREVAKILGDKFPNKPTGKTLRPGIHVSTKNPNPAVVLHELAHIHDMGNSARKRQIAGAAQALGGVGWLGMTLAALAKPSIGKLAPLVVAAKSAPMLYSEGKASVLATKHLMDERGNMEGIRDGAKALAPGFLTYLALPAIAAGMSLAQYKVMKKLRGL